MGVILKKILQYAVINFVFKKEKTLFTIYIEEKTFKKIALIIYF